MKIHLNAHQYLFLTIYVVSSAFKFLLYSKIRTLLYSNKEWLQGDICPECLKVGTEGIKAKMNVVRLLTQLSSNRSQNVSASELAFKLLETSEEDVQFPTFYQWFLKKLEILLLGSRELEAAELEVFSSD
jgi:hypothetical protein